MNASSSFVRVTDFHQGRSKKQLVVKQKHSKMSKLQRNKRQGKRGFGKELQNQRFTEYIPKDDISTASSLKASPAKPDSSFQKEIPRRDPQLAECYRTKIFQFLTQKDPSRKIAIEALSEQKEVTKGMRTILIDWLVDVSFKFKILDDSLFAAVWILDRFLNVNRSVNRSLLQLYGATCLMIACKFEEVRPPSLKDYETVCDGAYTETDILEAEAEILNTLQFDISVTTSFVFYKTFTRAIGLKKGKAFYYGEYLLTVALLNETQFKFSSMELACGAVFLVGKMFKPFADWAKRVSDIIDCPDKIVKTAAKALYKNLKTIPQSFTAVKRKYARKEVFEVSKFKVERVSKAKKA